MKFISRKTAAITSLVFLVTQLLPAEEAAIEVKKEKNPLSVYFWTEISRNRENMESIGQNAYALFRLQPRYTLSSDWSFAATFEGRQRLKPQKVWNWSDFRLSARSPSYDLGPSPFSFRFAPSLTLPISKFSRHDLNMRLGIGATGTLTWKLSEAEEWSLNSLSYSLSVNRRFYRFKTDVAGKPVTEWTISHSLGSDFSLFSKLSLGLGVDFDSEFHSSGKVFSSYALSADLNYAWQDYFSTYLSVSNSGDSLKLQEKFSRLGKFNERDTQFSIGATLSY